MNEYSTLLHNVRHPKKSLHSHPSESKHNFRCKTSCISIHLIPIFSSRGWKWWSPSIIPHYHIFNTKYTYFCESSLDPIAATKINTHYMYFNRKHTDIEKNVPSRCNVVLFHMYRYDYYNISVWYDVRMR